MCRLVSSLLRLSSNEDYMKTARFIVACCISIGSLSPIGTSAADDPVPKFEKFLLAAKDATNEGTLVYLNQHKQAWAKRRFSANDVKFDVKKTDSLLNPILGLVTLSLVTEQTDLYPTEEEAAASVVFEPKFSTRYRVSLTYSYKDAKWSFSKGTYESFAPFMKGKTFDLSEEKIRNEPTATPTAALMYWLPK